MAPMVAANQSSESKHSLCGERLSLDSDGDLKGVERERHVLNWPITETDAQSTCKMLFMARD